MIYEVRFTLGDGLESANPKDAPKFDDEKKIESKQPRASEDIVLDKDAKQRKAKVIGYASLAVSQATRATGMYFNYQNTNYQISGDYIGAQRSQNIQSNVNELVGIGSSIGFGLAVGGLAGGGAALAMVAYQYAIKSYNFSLETKKYIAQVQSDNIESQYKRDRLVTNIKDVR